MSDKKYAIIIFRETSTTFAIRAGEADPVEFLVKTDFGFNLVLEAGSSLSDFFKTDLLIESVEKLRRHVVDQTGHDISAVVAGIGNETCLSAIADEGIHVALGELDYSFEDLSVIACDMIWPEDGHAPTLQ